MKKTPKKSQKKDLPSVYIALLALAVIIVVFFLAYLSKMSKLPNGGAVSTSQQAISGQQVMNGQQTATITILPSGSEVTNVSGTTQPVAQPRTTMPESTGSVAAGNRVKFKIDHFKKLALQPLIFDVMDENGKAYTPNDLQGVNGQKIHFIVVSADLREYQHLNPTYENGKWNVLANLPNVGTYHAYVDITPVKGQPVVLRRDLIAQQPTTTVTNYPGLTPNLFALVTAQKIYKAQLTITQPLVLQQSVLSYFVTTNGVVAQLNSFLNGFGFVVVFRQGDADSFTHLQPLSSTNAPQGLAEFMTTFVKGGRYTAFAEFKIGNLVRTFPITFDIHG